MNEKNDMHYAFFQNRECEYFPCHEGANEADFNCLFCWCPLYTLGEGCGGNFHYLPDGTKDCINCLLPHNTMSYAYICGKFSKLKELAEKKS